MNGRFPHDVFMIIAVPFIAIALGVFLPALLMPAHVHHRIAVIVAVIVFAVVAVSAVGIMWRRRSTAHRR